jgi:D-alanine-D-alanine ligase
MQVDHDWWKDLFDETYLQTDARSVCDDRLTCREVDFLENVFGFSKSSPILDLCGGQGRHALELSRRGFLRVILLDYSDYLTGAGKKRARDEGLNTAFVRGDARSAGLRSQAFRVVLIMGSSFGYFEDEAENCKMLDEAFRLLGPGGELFLDLPDRDFVLQKFKPLIRHQVGEDLEVTRTRILKNDVIYSREVVTSASRGCIRDRTYCTRLYGPEKISELLIASGFGRVGFEADFMCRQKEGEFGTMTSRMLVRAEKTPGRNTI